MNLRLAILVASLVANVALATYIAIQRTSSTRSSAPASTYSPERSPSGKSRENQSPDSLVTSERALAVATASAFHWSQLESEDYKEYISRLRSFGVPEKVIRDIIIADVQKLYRPRFAALRPPKKPANPNFWETRNQGFYPNRDQTKEQREQTRALQKEQTELIKELLGVDVYEQIARESGYPDWTERMYGPLSKEDREKVTELQQRFQEAQADIYAKADGYIDQDTQAELAALRRNHRDELAKVLSPEQLQEYELRSSETAQRMKWELAWFEPSEKEFRAIHAFKQASEEASYVNSVDGAGQQTAEERMAQQKKIKDLETALAETLGADRAREYKLSEQYEYRNLLEAGVPRENVFKLVDMREEVESAARKLRQDKSLSNEQRNDALRAIKVETEKTLNEMLGERRAKYYTSSSGWWLRNLVPSSP